MGFPWLSPMSLFYFVEQICPAKASYEFVGRVWGGRGAGVGRVWGGCGVDVGRHISVELF